MTRVVLVHPPLLGPAVWAPCASALHRAGHSVAVPDLRAAVSRADGWWRRVADLCRPLLGSDVVVAGHSGAGVVLPSIVAGVSVQRVVLVDAVVPARSGWSVPRQQLRAFATSQVDGDRLRRWSEWWDADEIAGLARDRDALDRVIAEQPRLPAARGRATTGLRQ